MPRYRVEVYYKHEDNEPRCPFSSWEGNALSVGDAVVKTVYKIGNKRLQTPVSFDVEEIH